MSSSLRIDVLSSIRHVASKLSSLPGRCGIEAETYYWTAIYHLNIRLYEKLLFGVFDVLDEGQLIEVDFRTSFFFFLSCVACKFVADFKCISGCLINAFPFEINLVDIGHN